MSLIHKLAATAAVVMLGAPCFAQDELAFPLDEAPAGALATAEAAAPDVTFDTADVEVEDGVVTLEFSGLNPDGARIEVDVAFGWLVLEVEEMIALEDTPEHVRETLELQLPGFEPTAVERSDRGDGVFVYEFEGVDAEGVAIDVEIQADGESVVVLDDEET